MNFGQKGSIGKKRELSSKAPGGVNVKQDHPGDYYAAKRPGKDSA